MTFKTLVAPAVPFLGSLSNDNGINNISSELLQRELQNEHEALENTMERYQKNLNKTLERKQGSQTLPARLLISRITETYIGAIKDFIRPKEKSRGWNAGVKGDVRTLIKKLKLTPEQLAYTTLKSVLDLLFLTSESQGITLLTRVLETISNSCLQTSEVAKFKELYPLELKQLLNQQKKKNVVSKVHLYRVLSIAQTALAGKRVRNLSVNESIQLGSKLLDLLITSTGAFEYYLFRGKSKKHQALRITPETNKILNESPEFFAFFQPMYPIMICPPKPWTDLKSGGYWLGGKLQAAFVRHDHKTLMRHTQELSLDAMPKVYEAVNHIQSTAWKVNKRVLEVFETFWNNFGGDLAGIPAKQALEIPPKPWGELSDTEFKLYKEEHNEEFRAWARKASEIHDMNHKNTLQRCIIRRKLEITNKVKDEKAIYFPHYTDFRGRVYPLPAYVNPQGDDSGKALIHFSEGKPLKNQEGVNWLAIHGANLAGIDKVSFDERIQWVKDNEQMILQSAKTPLDCLWWTDIDDKPFQFLAFCFEWRDFKEQGIENFISHLPIAMDGTCNGLQHLSAMLLDEEGGKAVNLVPSDNPSDIYTLVLDKTKELIQRDIETTEDQTDRLIGSVWLQEGKLTRKIVKRPVMTTPYGVKTYRITEQICEFSDELFGNGQGYSVDAFKFAQYLTRHLVKAINETVVSAKEAMDYLKLITKDYCEDTQEMLAWEVPLTGFKVLQASFEITTKQIEIYQGKQRIQPLVASGTDKISHSDQISGVAPNLIHSLDAAHLMQTALKLKASEISSMAFIHDSYAVHACDTGLLNRLLRESFIDLYTCDGGNVLEGFRSQLQERINEKALQKLEPMEAIELSEIPSRGNLNIYETMESPYFFS